MSPISSRKIVPLSASSNRPLRRASAEVNAPFSWPNSSLSSSVLGQRRAVDRDQVPLPLLARVVDGLGDQLLAGAGLALDQDGALGPGDVADQLEDAVHLRVLADDVVEAVALLELLAEPQDLVLKRPLLQRPVHHQLQVVRVDRLGQEVVGPQPHRLDDAVDRAEAGRHDRGDQHPALGDLADQVHPAHARASEVGDQHAVVGPAQAPSAPPGRWRRYRRSARPIPGACEAASSDRGRRRQRAVSFACCSFLVLASGSPGPQPLGSPSDVAARL